MGREYAPLAYSIFLFWKYRLGLPSGALLADSGAVQESADAVELAQRYGDDLALEAARFVRGLILAQQDSPEREEGLCLLATAREVALQRSLSAFLPVIDLEFAREQVRTRDLDAAIQLLRQVADRESRSGDGVLRTVAVGRFVESLLARGADADIDEADRQVQRMARAAQADSGMAIEEIWLLRLRALLARARGDAVAYADFKDRYRDMATTLGYEGHMDWAEAMA
jgi:adenylate cyclase